MKIAIASYLMEEIEYEQELFKLYNADIKQAVAKAELAGNYSTWRYREYKGRKPSKARILNNCKKIRQLILDLSREEF